MASGITVIPDISQATGISSGFADISAGPGITGTAPTVVSGALLTEAGGAILTESGQPILT